MKYKYNLTGKSLLTLKQEGFNFFSDWWEDEPFANETTKPITVTIDTDKQIIKDSLNKTYKKCEKIAKKANVPILTASQYVELLDLHFKATGEYLLRDYYTWTADVTSDGYLVLLGNFDPGGLRVGRWNPDDAGPLIGVCFSTVSSGSYTKDLAFGSGDLEKRVMELEKDMDKLKNIINI